MQFKMRGQHLHRCRHLGVRLQRHVEAIADNLCNAHVCRREAHQPRLFGSVDHDALQARPLFLAALPIGKVVAGVTLVVVIIVIVIMAKLLV